MYSTEYTITKDDLDIYLCMSTTLNIFLFFEQCRWAFAKEIGNDQDYVMKEKKGICNHRSKHTIFKRSQTWRHL